MFDSYCSTFEKYKNQIDDMHMSGNGPVLFQNFEEECKTLQRMNERLVNENSRLHHAFYNERNAKEKALADLAQQHSVTAEQFETLGDQMTENMILSDQLETAIENVHERDQVIQDLMTDNWKLYEKIYSLEERNKLLYEKIDDLEEHNNKMQKFVCSW